MPDTSNLTRIIEAVARGERHAANDLLPLVYDELRRLAAQKLAHEPAGLTLQPTALVHEAYLRLVDVPEPQQWDSRRHFFAAAAEAMRRILVEAARRRHSIKRGGDLVRRDIDDLDIPLRQPPAEVLAIHEALGKLAETDSRAAELVKLRYFAGFTMKEAVEVLNIAPRTADDIWAYARAWLAAEIQTNE